MIAKVEVFFRKFRRLFSRTEWAIRLLNLPKRKDPGAPFGLVMVQIDGLSLNQFNRAMRRNKLPFLKSLLYRERYTTHSFYSGLPSNTPGVQGELFYGIKTAVPAFNFLDRRSGTVVRMYDVPSAVMIESRLKESGQGLLTGGSAYCDIFCGGAQEAHFCAGKTGWEGILRAASPWVLPFLVICYADIFIRTSLLMVIEFFLALIDCARGTIQGKFFWKEFEFIPARVMVCVLLRELIVAGACMDIARGLPVIHLNFIGYDEQSHRRGPSSMFAHWSLQGIDDSIRRVWNAAGRARLKDYDVWIYSDHGQEKTVPFPVANGCTLEEAVKKIFGHKMPKQKFYPGYEPVGSAVWRALWRGKHPVKKGPGDDGVLVTAMGPAGYVYLKKNFSQAHREQFAERLVREARIPMVLMTAGPKKAWAWTGKGKFSLPAQAIDVFGKDHPFLEEAPEDLVALCHHPDAGDFTLMGWAEGQAPMTFPVENGAHAGIGPEETNGFAFLPLDTPLEPGSKNYLRALDLREAALRILGKNPAGPGLPRARASAQRTLRVLTYNVHGCVGMDGRTSVERIARVIARQDPDLVALQELNAGPARPAGADQAERLAQKLEMRFHFHPAYRLNDQRRGNAVLSRYPLTIIKMENLPAARGEKSLEPRGALWSCVEMGALKVQIINTHLSLWPRERLRQARALAGVHWLSHPDCKGPVILCGDFNTLPRSAPYKKIISVLQDSQKMLTKHVPYQTWLGRYPFARIDHVFLSPEWEVTAVKVPRTSLDRVASDHLPLVVDLKLK